MRDSARITNRNLPSYLCNQNSESCVHATGQYRITTSFAVFGGEVQKRWYVDEVHTNIETTSAHVYGAIELLSNPWTLKAWKMIQGTWEEDMILERLYTEIHPDSSLDVTAALTWLQVFTQIKGNFNNKTYISQLEEFKTRLASNIRDTSSNVEKIKLSALCDALAFESSFHESAACYSSILTTFIGDIFQRTYFCNDYNYPSTEVPSFFKPPFENRSPLWTNPLACDLMAPKTLEIMQSEEQCLQFSALVRMSLLFMAKPQSDVLSARTVTSILLNKMQGAISSRLRLMMAPLLGISNVDHGKFESQRHASQEIAVHIIIGLHAIVDYILHGNQRANIVSKYMSSPISNTVIQIMCLYSSDMGVCTALNDESSKRIPRIVTMHGETIPVKVLQSASQRLIAVSVKATCDALLEDRTAAKPSTHGLSDARLQSPPLRTSFGFDVFSLYGSPGSQEAIVKTCHALRESLDLEASATMDAVRDLDRSVSLVITLLGLGNVETAALHASAAAAAASFPYHDVTTSDREEDVTTSDWAEDLTTPNFPTHPQGYAPRDQLLLQTQLADLIENNVELGDILESRLASPQIANLRRVLLDSPNVRAALILRRFGLLGSLDHVHTAMNNQNQAQSHSHSQSQSQSQSQWIGLKPLMQHRALTLFLNTLTQVCTPVILSSPYDYWSAEALVLRTVLVEALGALVSMCSPIPVTSPVEQGSMEAVGGSACILQEATSNVGARGLFLLAYQGLQLGHQLRYYNGSIYQDYYIPMQYEKLIKATNPQMPWQFSTSFAAAAIRENEEVEIASSERRSLANQRRLHNATSTLHRSNGKLRIGFLSSFFYRHSVGRLLGNIIIKLDRTKFDVFVLADSGGAKLAGRRLDDLTIAIKQSLPKENWILLSGNLEISSARARSVGLDVLVYGDIFMDAITAHLAMIRLAPIQAAFWGHPFSSGYTAIDYFISTHDFEPPPPFTRMGSYSEQLVLFDSLSFQMFAPAPDGEGGGGGYRSGRPLSGGGGGGTGRETQMPMPRAADLGPQQFRVQFLQWVLATGFHLSGAKYLTAVGGDFVAVECVQWLMNQSSATDEKHIDALAEANHCTASFSSLRIYGCYQSLMKMHPLFDRAIVQILQRDSQGFIVLARNAKQTMWQAAFQARLLEALLAAKVEPNRLIFLDQMPHGDYLTVVCGVDVTLDPFPFGGGVTLTDSLSCPSRNRSSRNPGSKYDPVPFVTSSLLQSVHRIGGGIAAALQTPRLATDSAMSTVDLGLDTHSSHPSAAVICSKGQEIRDRKRGQRSSSIALSEQCTDALIEQYALTATRLAQQHYRAIFTESIREASNTTSTADDQDALIDEQIFSGAAVIDEWNQFLERAAVH